MAELNKSVMLQVLLTCGAASSAVYVTSDVVGALSYPNYNYAAQAISEMSATGAPTVSLLAPFYRTFSTLFVLFAAGVWLAGSRDSRLRWSAAFMLGVALVGAGLSVFPMNMRGMDRTTSDTMHLLFAGATMLLLSGAILSGGAAFNRSFRLYSAATVFTMLIFFVFTLADAPNVAANRATPFMGINERVSMAAWLLWVVLFSVKLLRRGGPQQTASATFL